MANAKITIDIDATKAIKNTQDLSNSVGETIKTINDLESEIRSLTDELNSTEFGTERFKELQSSLVQASGKMKDFELSIESLDAEQRASEFGSFAAGLADITTGALAMSEAFGVSSESAEEFTSTIVGGFAIANSFRGGIEGIISAQKLLKNSTIGTTIATKGGTVAMRIFNTVVKANPIGLLVTALLAGVAAFSLFNSSSEDAEENAEELEKAEKKLLNTYEKQLETLKRIKSERDVRQVLKTTKEILGVENELIILNDKLADVRREQPDNINAQVDALKNVQDAEMRLAELKGKANLDEMRTEEQINDELNAAIKIRTQATKAGNEQEIESARRLVDQLAEETLNYNQTRENAIQESNNNLLKLRLKHENDIADLRKKSSSKTDKEVNEKSVETNAAFYDELERRRKAALEGEEAELQSAADNYDAIVKLAEKTGEDITQVTEDYQSEVNAINEKWNNIRANQESRLNAEILIIQEELLMQKELNEASSEEERLKIRKKYDDRLNKLRIDQLKNEKNIILNNTEITEEEREKLILEKDLEIAKIRDQGIEEASTAFMDNMAEMADALALWGGATMQLVSNIMDFMNMKAENASIERENQFNQETERLQHQLNERLISEEEFDAKVANLERQKDARDLIERRKQFKREKAFNIAQAVMNTAQAVLQALGSMPPPASYIMAAINGAMGAVQVATISQQQFKAARGGVVPGNQRTHMDSVPATLAPGESVINSRASGMFPNLLSEINQLGGGVPLRGNPGITNNNMGENKPVYSDNKEMTVKVNVGVQEITDTQDRLTRYRELNEF
jgi:hypothetical protein